MADEPYLIFLSHKAEVRGQVQNLKEGLESYGVEAFVAHSDIYPGAEWQEEILEVLEDMDAFVPILTKDFRDSEWTDQEVGYALAREVPIIPLIVGMNPYGFIGKYQGIKCSWKDAPMEIVKALMDDSEMVDTFINAVFDCQSLTQANRLSRILPSIEGLTKEQVSRMVAAFKENEFVNNSYGFNGTRPSQFGDGLPALLSEITEQPFGLRKDLRDRFYIDPPLYWGYRVFT